MVISGGSKMETHRIDDIQIPIGAEVSCTDGVFGESTYVLINPVTEKVTHLVVKEAPLQHPEYVVPIGLIAATSANNIQLRCTCNELRHMEPFIQTQYIKEPMPEAVYDNVYARGSYLLWPYAVGDTMTWEPVDQKQIPPGELAVRRGTRVEATDGDVGHVDEFVLNPGTGNITHLVMREGHLWGQKDVSIPVSAIRETRDDVVILNLNKQEIKDLVSIPIRRPQSRTS